MRFFAEAFTDPDNLAALIFHESTHWVDTVANAGQRRTLAERLELEGRAYARQAQFYQGLGMPGPAHNARRLADQHDRVAQQARERGMTNEKALIDPYFRRWLPNISSDPGGAVGPAETDNGIESIREGSAYDFLQSWTRDASAVTAQARQAELARLEEERVRRQTREEEERRRRAEQESTDPGWVALRAWAGTACSYIKNYPDIIRLSPDVMVDAKTSQWVADENERRKTQARESDATMRAYLLTHYVALPRDEIDARLRDRRTKVDSCQRDLLEAIRDARAPIDAASLVERLDYEKGGGAVGVGLRGVVGAIRSGVTEVVEGLTAPFVYSESEEKSPRGRRERGQPRDRAYDEERRSNRIPGIDDTRSIRDLRGVGSKNWRGL